MKSLMATCLVLMLTAGMGIAGAPDAGRSARPGAENVSTAASLDRALAERDFAGVERAVKDVNAAKDGRAAVPFVRPRLSDRDPGVRRLAAYALIQIDPDEAKKEMPALLAALQDPEPRVRARVALAIGKTGQAAPSIISALGAVLKDADPRARAGAAYALGSIGVAARDTIPALIDLLKDVQAPVRGMAARALSRMGPAAVAAVPGLNALQAADPDPDVQAAAAAALEEISPTVQVLDEALASPDPVRRLWAVAALAAKGPDARPAVSHLIEILKGDEDPAVRAGAAFALGKAGPAGNGVCAVLIEALKDRAARVRTAATLGLGLIGPGAKGAGGALAAALTDEDAEVASSAATALGNLGTEAEPAVPMLGRLLEQDNVTFRRRALHTLAGIGPPVREAVPALLKTLNDNDPTFRREAARALVSAGPQAGAAVHVLVEMLTCTETDADRAVRAWACLSLAEVGARAAAQAVQPLIRGLHDNDGNVRAAAALALARMGPAALPALVKSLDDVDPHVRAGSAQALGGIGPGAKRALPALRAALEDDDPEVGLAVGLALGRLAAGLQLAEDTQTLGCLQETLKAVEGVKAKLPAEQAAAWNTPVEQVRQAIQALQTVQRARSLDRVLGSPWFAWLAGLLVYVGFLLSCWSLLLWLRPLLLLRINEALQPLPHARLPGLLGGMEISLRGLLLVGFFHYHRRVLDAWVARHLERFRANYLDRRTVKDRAVFVPVPVVLDGAVIAGLTPQQMGKPFGRRRGCLLIWGEGGAGKTTLACQVGRWALAVDRSERLCGHVMLPILVEHELDLKTAEGKPGFAALTEAVRGQLMALIGETTPLPEELVENLLRRRRILVIVDHLSEVGPAVRDAIRPGHAEFPAHALVVTSRSEEVLDGVPRSVVQPLRIEGNRLSSFMEAYLVQRGKRQLFDDAEFFGACGRLSLLAGTREITVLLAKLYAEQMIARKESRPQDPLPANLPDLILGYLNELNGAVAREQRRSDFEVQRDAGALAWECLRNHLRPESADLEAALEALGGEDARARLGYLEDQLRIVRASEPARDRVFFTLDPLAEYLAALHLVHRNRGDARFWREFAAQAATLQADGHAIKGFLLAVRECCLVRNGGAGVVELLDEQLGRAA